MSALEVIGSVAPYPPGYPLYDQPKARIDVLDKLLALNHYRHQQEEVECGLTKKTRPKSRKTRQAPRAPADSPFVDSDAPLSPPNALF